SNALDLARRLASAERVDDRVRRDEAVGELGSAERLLELEPEAVRETVSGRIASRVVERDGSRGQAAHHLDERRLDALVVTDDRVSADLLDRGGIEATDDRDALAGRGHDERAGPGAVHAGDQVEARVAREHRLADEGEPHVDVVLAQDLYGLIELFLGESGG